MIQTKDKHNCCGCQACVQKCPKHCISLEEDEEGFLYPEIDKDKCVDCGLCEKVCPCVKIEPHKPHPESVIAFKNEDESIRRNSSSGGAFTAIATPILNDGGVVFGARFNEKWQVVHSYTETVEGLSAFRGSKYVQSYIGNSYCDVKRFLKDGRKVLFTGTPCQVKALHLFLRKEYDNLITMDFVCHGVPSPGVFRGYLQSCLNQIAREGEKNTVSLFPTDPFIIPKGDVVIPEGLEVNDIRFRDKTVGWKKFSFALSLAKATAAGEKIQFALSNDLTKNPYLKGFISDLYLRPSCFNCPAKGLTSGSDITVADFWGQEYNFPEFDNDTGVSAMIVNTPKGQASVKDINGCEKRELPFNVFFGYNPSVYRSVKPKHSRKKFWKYIREEKYNLQELIKKSSEQSIMERVILKLEKMLIK